MRTFSFLVLCLMGFFFMACDDDENRLGDWALGSAWPGEVRNQAVCFVIDDYSYVGLGIGINGAEYTNFRKMNLNTGYWTVDSVAPFPGKGRHAAVAFAVNGKAYVGTGFRVAVNWGDEQYNREYLYDFWEYDPSGTTTEDGVTYQGKWTRAADFPHPPIPRSDTPMPVSAPPALLKLTAWVNVSSLIIISCGISICVRLRALYERWRASEKPFSSRGMKGSGNRMSLSSWISERCIFSSPSIEGLNGNGL